MEKINDRVQAVQDKLEELGFANRVVVLPDSARTAQEAAEAIGCEVAQIAKSIIFRMKQSEKPLLVVASGTNRINEKRIGQEIGEKLGKADADFVREHTGFVIGGIPPIGHKEQIVTLIDEDLLPYAEIWAAAGHPHAVFPLTPQELIGMTSGRVMPVV
ncbi:YbaK/EbsC family protein [Paenibacillus thiaminolyticus]|uniref:YbaK/EbsC family protein n=1 Tax=Paenibacillus TaxID=44249 RepID=UPI001059C17E|nr:YbaK/EbsC family protein [Paenibacillus dendritiformis]TDL58021.1 YbaK/EbsC family protein [Paenibacillus dendritiformis]